MSFPYVSDLANALFGTQLQLPIPTFGVLTASAIAVAAWMLRMFPRLLFSVAVLSALSACVSR